MAPKFVFVFDELDKIEQKPLGTIEESTTEISYVLSEGLRKRQATVSKLLANLKHFFNVTKAKFVFIAGREMYDAAMADISDRDSFLGSIFHDVIYIDSFYKDHLNEKEEGISTLTEAYVCQFLLHQGSEKSSTINDYYINRKREYETTNRDLKELHKAILVLYDFTNYLTYRCNGSPKKLTKLFEEYITLLETDEINTVSDKQKNILIGDKNSNNLFLKFAFYDQYIFGFTSSVFNPFMFKLNKHTKDYSDKLLVSTSFLIDHVFKFHGIGFSFSNLELTPEIVAVNKAPELRDFINRIIRFYKNIYIREILSGLHEFKFNSRIEREIRYISTISDRESAAFNFTLDESVQLKTYYINLLTEMNKIDPVNLNWSNSNIKIQTQRSKTDILNILGDLYYNDQEFDDAIRYYLDAFNNCIETDLTLIDQTRLIEIITCKLKLGLTYERKHSFDQALMEYESLTELVLTKIHSIQNISNGNNQYLLSSGLRISYQSLLAELQVLEKNSIKSLTHDYLKLNEKRFRELTRELSNTQKFLIEAEYYDKVGDILYYKNGKLFEENNSREEEFAKFYYKAPEWAYVYYFKSLQILRQRIINGKFNKQTYSIYPIGGTNYRCENEAQIFNNFLAYILDFSTSSYSLPEIRTNRKSPLESIANALSDLGDCILCTPKKIENLCLIRVKSLLNLRFSRKNDDSGRPFNFDENYFRSFNDYERAIGFYILSSMYNAQAGEVKEYCFQLTKILYLFKEIISQSDCKDIYTADGILPLWVKFMESISERILLAYNKAYLSMPQYELEKILKLFRDTETDPNLSSYLKRNLSIATEVKEVLLLIVGIKMKLYKNDANKLNEVRAKANELISGLNTIRNKYIRNLELNLANDLYNSILDENSLSLDEQEKIIIDAIHAQLESIKARNIFGLSYIHNHSIMASAYYRLFKWVEKFNEIKKEKNDSSQNLSDIFGSEISNELITTYLIEKVEEHNYKCIQTHHQGEAYREFISDMYYLDDDFNDNLFHFCAALERMKINTGMITSKLSKHAIVAKVSIEPRNAYIDSFFSVPTDAYEPIK